MAFTKLISTITDSTIWREPDTTRIVWITMLAMADQHGVVAAAVPGLADRARVSLDATLAALATFKSPDQWSRTKDYEGRRIADVEGGWVLLNHEKHRAAVNAEDRREAAKLGMRKLRAKLAAGAEPVNGVNSGDQKLRQAEAEEDSKSEEKEHPSFKDSLVASDANAAAPARVAKAPPAPRGKRLDPEWLLPKAWGEWAMAEFPAWTTDRVRREAESFRDFWVAKAGKDAAKLDWQATWRNWCRNAKPDKPATTGKHAGFDMKDYRAGDGSDGLIPG